MIKQNKGFERIKILWSGLREYRCRACDEVFRAADRRKRVRPEHPASAASRQPA